MKWYAYRNLNWDSTDLALIVERGGRRMFAKPVEFVFEEVEEGMPHEPTARLQGDLAKSLFQALWDEGFRPVTGEGGNAEANALRNHIKFAERVTDSLLRTSDKGSV